MRTNELPAYHTGDNPTGCCPRFTPQGWDGRELHFQDKLFVRATTRSLLYVPLGMGAMYKRISAAIEAADATDPHAPIVLSRDLSPWQAEHLFAVTREVPGQAMVRLSGDFLTQVFEGPYSRARNWMAEVARKVEASGRRLVRTYLFYTTCPRCAKTYGKNYVVAVAELG